MKPNLTPEEVILIRKMYVKNAYPPHPGSVTMLAKKFNVSKHVITDVIKYRTYKNIMEEGDVHDE